MKKLSVLLMTGIMVLGLTACGGGAGSSADSKPVNDNKKQEEPVNSDTSDNEEFEEAEEVEEEPEGEVAELVEVDEFEEEEDPFESEEEEEVYYDENGVQYSSDLEYLVGTWVSEDDVETWLCFTRDGYFINSYSGDIYLGTWEYTGEFDVEATLYYDYVDREEDTLVVYEENHLSLNGLGNFERSTKDFSLYNDYMGGITESDDDNYAIGLSGSYQGSNGIFDFSLELYDDASYSLTADGGLDEVGSFYFDGENLSLTPADGGSIRNYTVSGEQIISEDGTLVYDRLR